MTTLIKGLTAILLGIVLGFTAGETTYERKIESFEEWGYLTYYDYNFDSLEYIKVPNYLSERERIETRLAFESFSYMQARLKRGDTEPMKQFIKILVEHIRRDTDWDLEFIPPDTVRIVYFHHDSTQSPVR